MGTKHIVAIYRCDRRYGGPEEGGWYYDCGEWERTLRVFGNEDLAYDYCRRVNDKLRGLVNSKRRPMSSVLSEGEYWAEVYENTPPMYYPEARPHYE